MLRELGLAFAISLFVAFWTQVTLRNIVRQPLLRRRNYLNEEVVGSAGLSFVGSAVWGWLFSCWWLGLDWHEGGALILAAFWFGALGLIDDLSVGAMVKGWRGHFRAFFRERKITTGFVKAVGGGIGALVLAIWIASVTVPPSVPCFSLQWLSLLALDTFLIGLCANTLNLLDVRPSRALKGFWLLTLIGVIVSRGDGWLALLPLWAGTLAYALADFRRQVMMGDSGANPLGACFGVWVLHHWMPTPPTHWSPALWLLLLAVVALQIYAERRSLTADIQRIPFLRWLDELGVKR